MSTLLSTEMWEFVLHGGIKWRIISDRWDIVGKYFTYKIMLIGEYKHTIDDKNRLSLPSKFRKEIGKKVVITPGLDNCLFVYTIKEWEKFSSRLSEFSMLTADNRSFNRFIFGQAVETDIDAIGRILVPDFLKEWAGLKSKAVVIGVQNRIEVWSETKWASYKNVVEKQADQLAEKLGGAGML